jgi:DNA-binding NarL/FixJ family response regulator
MDTPTEAALVHPTSPMRVVVADDHAVVFEGWRMIIATLPEAALVGWARNGVEAVGLVAEQRPHVVVMDLGMPELDGVEATRQVVQNQPDLAVLVLSMHDDDESITAALEAGARGYVLKGAGRDELILALRAVAAGQVTFGAELGDRVLNRLIWAGPAVRKPTFPGLTARELEILDLLAAGWSANRIARALFVEPKTIRNHIGNILSKLGAATRLEAVLMAHAAGLGRINSGDPLHQPPDDAKTKP